MAVPLTLDSLVRREPDMAAVETLLRELEFVRLLDRLKPIAHRPPTLQVDAEGKMLQTPPAAAPDVADDRRAAARHRHR